MVIVGVVDNAGMRTMSEAVGGFPPLQFAPLLQDPPDEAIQSLKLADNPKDVALYVGMSELTSLMVEKVPLTADAVSGVCVPSIPAYEPR